MEHQSSLHRSLFYNEIIVAFQNKHYVFDNAEASSSSILDRIRDCTGWPTRFLSIQHISGPSETESLDSEHTSCHVLVRAKSMILGGKGGFGSLLKSQSRQAGARSTTNFGACRDLQGRRLRHVNDAVAAARMQEWKERIAAGQATKEDQAKAITLETESQVPGWFLQLPSWSDVSKKEHRKWKRQYKQWERDQDMERSWKEEQKRRREACVTQYVEKANQASESVRSSLQSALQEGLKKKQQQPQATTTAAAASSLTTSDTSTSKRVKHQPEPPTAFLTLSGDVVLANENDHWQVQSQSNFCTFGIVLSWDLLRPEQHVLYWECQLVTGGLSQIGWAEPNPQRFKPESETGDGVGDDVGSFGYDGSRTICLHQSESKAYGAQAWKAGDIIGSLYNRSTGTISFTRNGQDLGVAYTVEPGTKLFPAASCNPKEILELHLTAATCEFLPASAIPVGEWLAKEDIEFDQETQEEEEEEEKEVHEKDDSKTVDDKTGETNSEPVPKEETTKKTEVIAEPLNLDEYSSVSELEALGLERLKGALMALDLKCGGTLQQRAERLFSIKGLKPDEYPEKLRVKKRKA